MAYLYIVKVVVLPTATATFAKSNETFSVSQAPSVSPKGKEVFLGIVLLW